MLRLVISKGDTKMTAQTIMHHIAKIEADTAEMNAAELAGDKMTADMIFDAICFRKAILAKHGVVIV